MASMIGTVSAGVGYPAVTKVTRAGSPYAFTLIPMILEPTIYTPLPAS